MNNDIRVKTTFPRHPKTIKLKRLIGTWEPIVVLWLWAAENRPNGDFSGMEIDDIAIAANWDDDPEKLISAMVSVRFMERVDGGAYVLHGWQEHNAYAANAEKRSEAARLAAQAKWGKRLGDPNKKKRSERMAEARKKGNHTQAQWEEMKAFFGTCVKCEGESGLINVDRDHIKPIYQGGSHGIDNIQPLCAKCNASKGPENIDYRIRFCENNELEMPAEWVRVAGVSHKKTSAPSPSPSPSPSPTKENGRARSLPKNFELTKPRIEYAKSKGVNVNRVESVFDHFRDHHKAKGSKFADWDAAWRNWVRKEIEFNQEGDIYEKWINQHS